MNKNKNFNKAFTLAEVLITLSILGVIAAITVPSIVRNFQDRATLSAFKKTFSTIDNALRQMYVVEGPYNQLDWPNPTSTYNAANSNFFAAKLSKYLNLSRYCENNYNYNSVLTYGCFSAKTGCTGGDSQKHYLPLSGGQCPSYGYWVESSNTKGKMILKDGTYISVSVANPKAFTGDNQIRVDLNGAKGPNRFGYDIFFFMWDIEHGGLMTAPWSTTWWKNNHDCQPTGSGIHCSQWVLKNGNFEYKKRTIDSNEW